MSARSLSRRLFIRIAPTIIIFALFVGGLAFYSATREINRVYDAQMISTANVLWSIVSDEVKEEASEKAKSVDDVDFSIGNQLAINDFADDYADAHMFRVWRADKIAMLSHDAPTAAISRQSAGFAEAEFQGEVWRIYALPLPGTPFSIEVGEKASLRKTLVDNILVDLLAPLLLLIPIAGLLIWLGINSGLGAVRTLAQQVKARSAEDLSPVDTGAMPDDLVPLGDSINQLMSKLGHSFAAEKRFVDDAAHYLRTPLAALKLQLQMLAQTTSDAERQALIGDLMRSNERAAKLVSQLLTSARLDHQKISLRPVPLHHTLSAVMAELGVLAAHKHLEMSLEGAPDAQVRAEEVLLRLMLENLVENAIKYTPPGGKIQVSVTPADGAWTVSIRDTGPGIPEDQRALVFERFYRLDGPTQEGSGLGLSIVADILKKFSGQIRLQDAPGAGLLAEVTLPVA